MTFPGASARIYTNDEGECVGWDYPSYDEPDYDPYDDYYDYDYDED